MLNKYIPTNLYSFANSDPYNDDNDSIEGNRSLRCILGYGKTLGVTYVENGTFVFNKSGSRTDAIMNHKVGPLGRNVTTPYQDIYINNYNSHHPAGINSSMVSLTGDGRVVLEDDIGPWYIGKAGTFNIPHKIRSDSESTIFLSGNDKGFDEATPVQGYLSYKNKIFLSPCADTNIYVLDKDSHALVKTIPVDEGGYTSIKLTKSGLLLFTPGGAGKLMILNPETYEVSYSDPIEVFTNNENLDKEKCIKYSASSNAQITLNELYFRFRSTELLRFSEDDFWNNSLVMQRHVIKVTKDMSAGLLEQYHDEAVHYMTGALKLFNGFKPAINWRQLMKKHALGIPIKIKETLPVIMVDILTGAVIRRDDFIAKFNIPETISMSYKLGGGEGYDYNLPYIAPISYMSKSGEYVNMGKVQVFADSYIMNNVVLNPANGPFIGIASDFSFDENAGYNTSYANRVFHTEQFYNISYFMMKHVFVLSDVVVMAPSETDKVMMVTPDLKVHYSLGELNPKHDYKDVSKPTDPPAMRFTGCVTSASGSLVYFAPFGYSKLIAYDIIGNTLLCGEGVDVVLPKRTRSLLATKSCPAGIKDTAYGACMGGASGLVGTSGLFGTCKYPIVVFGPMNISGVLVVDDALCVEKLLNVTTASTLYPKHTMNALPHMFHEDTRTYRKFWYCGD